MPSALKLAHSGKGILKETARRVIPSAVIDRPKGYFPVPALKYIEGPPIWTWSRTLCRHRQPRIGDCSSKANPGQAVCRSIRPYHTVARVRIVASRPFGDVASGIGGLGEDVSGTEKVTSTWASQVAAHSPGGNEHALCLARTHTAECCS